MPRLVGPYRFVSKLAPGGMGRVWRAVDTRDGTSVALKEPALEDCADSADRARALRRFDREARALARLDHPNVVRVREALVVDGRPYIAMELVDGETLDRVLARGRPPVPAAVGVVRQLLEAAAHAHGQGVVHRDIKPGNAFVLPDGVVKLGDFGIARLLDDTGTRTTTLVASVPYMSPEQAVGGSIDGRSDLFAIGILAYEALGGVHPFRQPGDQPMATVFRIVHERPRQLSAVRPELHPALSACVMRALEKEPAERFASAEEMREALLRAMPDREAEREALVALAATAPPPTRDIDELRPTRVMPAVAPTRVMPPVSPPPAPVAAPPARAVTPPAAPPVAPPVAPPPRAATPPPEPKPRRRRVWLAATAAALAMALALAFGAYRALQRPAPTLHRPVATVPLRAVPVIPADLPTTSTDAATEPAATGAAEAPAPDPHTYTAPPDPPAAAPEAPPHASPPAEENTAPDSGGGQQGSSDETAPSSSTATTSP